MARCFAAIANPFFVQTEDQVKNRIVPNTSLSLLVRPSLLLLRLALTQQCPLLLQRLPLIHKRHNERERFLSGKQPNLLQLCLVNPNIQQQALLNID